MARYLIKQSAYVNGEHIQADVRDPVVREFPDEMAPSEKWEPMDKGAQVALKKLAHTRLDNLPEEVRKRMSQAQIAKATAERPLVAGAAHPDAKKTGNGLPVPVKSQEL